MRSRRGPAIWVVLLVAVLLLGTSCDSDTPLEVQQQIIELFFTAVGARTDAFIVRDVFRDNNNDGLPDDVNGDGMPDVSLWCEAAGFVSLSSAPWTFAVEIKVLKAGESVAVPRSSPEALEDGTNMAPYDTAVGTVTSNRNDAFITSTRGVCSGDLSVICNPNSTSSFCADTVGGICIAAGFCDDDPSVLCGVDQDCVGQGAGPTCNTDPVLNRYVFDSNTKRLESAANLEILTSVPNMIWDLCVGDPTCTGVPLITPALGLCPGGNFLGEPRLDGNTTPASLIIVVDKGDTVIVEGRRFDTEPAGLDFGCPECASPSIKATITVDGQILAEDEVIGETSTQANSSSFLQFFYTSQ